MTTTGSQNGDSDAGQGLTRIGTDDDSGCRAARPCRPPRAARAAVSGAGADAARAGPLASVDDSDAARLRKTENSMPRTAATIHWRAPLAMDTGPRSYAAAAAAPRRMRCRAGAGRPRRAGGGPAMHCPSQQPHSSRSPSVRYSLARLWRRSHRARFNGVPAQTPGDKPASGSSSVLVRATSAALLCSGTDRILGGREKLTCLSSPSTCSPCAKESRSQSAGRREKSQGGASPEAHQPSKAREAQHTGPPKPRGTLFCFQSQTLCKDRSGIAFDDVNRPRADANDRGRVRERKASLMHSAKYFEWAKILCLWRQG